MAVVVIDAWKGQCAELRRHLEEDLGQHFDSVTSALELEERRYAEVLLLLEDVDEL